MRNYKKVIISIYSLIAIVAVGYSFCHNYKECQSNLYANVDAIFQKEASRWGESILQAEGLLYKGWYDLQEYADKKETLVVMESDTLKISSSFYHPETYSEYQRKNRETILLLDGGYDIEIADSLFKLALVDAGFASESSVKLKIRDLQQMFPVADSMQNDVPYTKCLSSSSVDGFITTPVGLGICNHGLIYGQVRIPTTFILQRMDWFAVPQLVIIALLLILFFSGYYLLKSLFDYCAFKKNVILVGNSCIDVVNHEVYLWSGERKHIARVKMTLLKMLLAAPNYKLTKEEICRTIWNRSAKDAQNLIHTAITDLRNNFISKDSSLELKTLSKEGSVQLFADSYKLKRCRKLHFMRLYQR